MSAKIIPVTTPIVFFDGVCGLCNRAVDFLLRIDRRQTTMFSPLQGEHAKASLPPDYFCRMDTIVFLKDGRTYEKSTAILKVLLHIGGIWKMAGLMFVCPRVIRDLCYDMIANQRYRIFGKKDACRIPTAAERGRFLP